MTATNGGGVRGSTLDTDALLALEHGDSRVRALLRRALEAGLPLSIPTGVMAQVWRGGPRQARVARLLADPSVHVAPLDNTTARAVGLFYRRSDHRDIVDVHVALLAQEQGHTVVTSGPEDLSAIHPSLPLTTV